MLLPITSHSNNTGIIEFRKRKQLCFADRKNKTTIRPENDFIIKYQPFIMIPLNGKFLRRPIIVVFRGKS